MTSNDLILQFLDGSLSSDAEAEFLHILSVSPERRESLRGFMRQHELFVRDKNAIAVPYAAEQKLWQRLGAVMPVAQSAEVVETAVTQVASPFWASVATPLVASIAVLTLTLGIGIGYTIGGNGTGNQSTITHYVETPAASSAPVQASLSPSERGGGLYGRGQSVIPAQSIQSASARYSTIIVPDIRLGSATGMRDLSTLLKDYLVQTTSQNSNVDLAIAGGQREKFDQDISSVEPRSVAHDDAVGGEQARPLYLHIENGEAPQKTLLQRFEFSFLESFGREIPNSAATNVSMPILTNAAVSVFFQVLPSTDALWVGASGGAANFSRKHLTTEAGDPGDPLQQQMTAAYSHTQANWAGAFLQYRIPLFAQSEVMLTGGYGYSTAGTMSMGELGLHVDATRDVGFTFGLRGVELNYDLSQEVATTMKSVRGPLVIPHGVANSAPSYNLELNTGLFFHF